MNSVDWNRLNFFFGRSKMIIHKKNQEDTHPVTEVI